MAQKRIIVNLTEQQHADLIVKLKYDGIPQTKFMRAYLVAYLEENQFIRGFISEYKNKNKIQNKNKLKKQNRISQKKEENINKFGLAEQEIENIFGWRTIRNKKIPQSHCKKCRSKKKD